MSVWYASNSTLSWWSARDPAKRCSASNVSLKLRMSVIDAPIAAASPSLPANYQRSSFNSPVPSVHFANFLFLLCKTSTSTTWSVTSLLRRRKCGVVSSSNINALRSTASSSSLASITKWFLLFAHSVLSRSFADQFAASVIKNIVSSVGCHLAPKNAALSVMPSHSSRTAICNTSVMSVEWMPLSSIQAFTMIRPVTSAYAKIAYKNCLKNAIINTWQGLSIIKRSASAVVPFSMLTKASKAALCVKELKAAPNIALTVNSIIASNVKISASTMTFANSSTNSLL